MTCADFFKDWAVVARKEATGFGRMAHDVQKVLGVGYHFVIPSDRIEGQPPAGDREFWFKEDAQDSEIEALYRKVRGIIFFEQCFWHKRMIDVAKRVGIKTVCVITWEWFKGVSDVWPNISLILCPTHFSLTIVAQYGYTNSAYLPWTIDIGQLAKRHIKGPARFFIHNAGLVDPDDRKGTRDTILAFKNVKRRDVRLLVRMQKAVPLPEPDERIEVQVGSLAHPAELYETGDVAIQPSKMEGIGFMVIEPVCCGMPTIACNYPPMNEFVRQPELRIDLQWFKRKAFPTQWIKHAHMRLPRLNDLTRRIEWCAENDLERISIANRAWAEEEFSAQRLQDLWFKKLSSL